MPLPKLLVMPLRRLGIAAVAVLTAVLSSHAAAAPARLSAPGGLRAFLLQASETTARSFPSTPSLAWRPVRGAVRYELELARSSMFDRESLVWSSRALKSPVAAPSIELPWLTGEPYAFYARVRAQVRDADAKRLVASPWSRSFGFNVGSPHAPQQLASYPGLVRWTPVEGATGYQVWFIDAGKVIETTTTVADEREYYTFHQQSPWADVVRWRVRAFRRLASAEATGSTQTSGAQQVNDLPAVTYGPWSRAGNRRWFTSTNPRLQAGSLTLKAAVSGAISNAGGAVREHRLTPPGFVFSGNAGLDSKPAGLYRVYVFSDRSCLNPIFRGAIVGSPAYAPRASGPLALPRDATEQAAAAKTYAEDGDEGTSYTADKKAITSSEASLSEATSPGTPPATASSTTQGAPQINFPDGSFYWTVVPVVTTVNATSGAVDYRDTDLPEDVCAAGRVAKFGVSSVPRVSDRGVPFVSGLTPEGTLFTAKTRLPKFYGSPLAAWQAVPGADRYAVEWSRTKSPWQPVGRTTTPTTSAVLPLAPGLWFYRVRGIDDSSLVDSASTPWSAALGVVVARPVYAVVAR